MSVCGKKNWIIPDCELPPEGEGILKGHESVIIVNDTDETAHIKVNLFSFTCLRANEEFFLTQRKNKNFDFIFSPENQYSLFVLNLKKSTI